MMADTNDDLETVKKECEVLVTCFGEYCRQVDCKKQTDTSLKKQI